VIDRFGSRVIPTSMRGTLMLLVSVVLLPLLAVQIGMGVVWYRNQWSDETMATLDTAMEAARTFEAYVDDVRRQESAIGAALSGPHRYATGEGNLLLTSAGRDYPSIRSWSWVNPEGQITASSDAKAIGLNVSDRSYFQDLRDGRPWAVSNLLTDRLTGAPIFVIASRVDDRKGSLAGAVIAVAEVGALGQRAVELNHPVGEAIALFDREGVLVYNSQKAQNIFQDWRGEDPLLAEALKSGTQRSGILTLAGDGKASEKYIAARVPVRGIGWVAGARRSLAKAMAGVYTTLWIAGGLTLLVAFGSGTLALTTNGSLIHQLRRLQSHAEAIGRGEFEHVVDSARVRELATLAAAFNRMGAAVHEGQEALEAANAALEQRVRERTAELAATIVRLERTERELRTASLYARGLIEASLDPLVTISPDGKITDVNEATEAATGLPRQQLAGSDFSDYFTEPDKARDGYQKVLSEGLVRDYPLTIRHASGRLIDVLYNAVVYRNEAGAVQGVFAAARDVTRQKEAEEELRQYREHLEELVARRTQELEVANRRLTEEIAERKRAAAETERWATFPKLNPNPITEVDLAGRVLLVNPTTERLFPDLQRRGLAHPWLADWESVRLAFQDGETRVKVRELMVGDKCYVQTIHHVKEIDRIRVYGLDITERRAAEEKLRHTAEQLTQSNRELEQFAYVASHDLQEPLRVVVGYVQLIERRYKDRLDADADEFIHYITDGVTRMQQLINDLLNYSRIGTRGKQFQTTDMRKVLDRALTNLQKVVEEGGAKITCDSLPSVRGDEIQLVQLLQNLIGNGIKFHSERPPEIDVSARRDGDQWVFAVHDNGIGIEPQYWEQIFVIFHRLHTRQRYAGTGIGLAICKRIVERHGGHIWLDSQPGQGTTFFFTLP
jgi:PAS domain S-box-containing protein